MTSFTIAVEKKLSALSKHPDIGTPRNKKHLNIRYVVLHKRVALVYRVRQKQKRIELLLFWNTYQHPGKLKIK